MSSKPTALIYVAAHDTCSYRHTAPPSSSPFVLILFSRFVFLLPLHMILGHLRMHHWESCALPSCPLRGRDRLGGKPALKSKLSLRSWPWLFTFSFFFCLAWKNGANSAVKCIRRLRLWACTHVEYGWVASGPWVASICKFQPANDVVFVFVFVLSVCPSRNRKSTCKNMAHPHVFVFIVCQSRNLSNVGFCGGKNHGSIKITYQCKNSVHFVSRRVTPSTRLEADQRTDQKGSPGFFLGRFELACRVSKLACGS